MKAFRQPATSKRALRVALAYGLIVAACIATRSAKAFELEGFTEPYRTINAASDETGTIEMVFVREGQTVEAGQPLARLNSDVHSALLAIAEQHMQATGQLDSVRADLSLRKDRLEKLLTLRSEGHARQEEVDLAAAEVRVAEAHVRSAQEDLLAKQLEFEKIKTQLARRTMYAPISGAVTKIHKDVGEFIAPNSPDLLTLVQIDRLLANFTLTSRQAETLRLDQEIEIRFSSGASTTGVVEFISPVTDAESGTVLVKLRIDNAERRFRSGERCRIDVAD